MAKQYKSGTELLESEEFKNAPDDDARRAFVIRVLKTSDPEAWKEFQAASAIDQNNFFNFYGLGDPAMKPEAAPDQGAPAADQGAPTAAQQMAEERKTDTEPPPQQGIFENPEDVTAGAGAAGFAYGTLQPFMQKAQGTTFTQLESAKNKFFAAEARLNNLRQAVGNVPSSAQARQAFEAALEARNAAQQELRVLQDAARAGNLPEPAPTRTAAAPITSSGDLVPTAEQQTRGIQGTTKDEGITGRQSQTTYSERTSQIARQQRAQQAALERLGQKGLIDPAKALQLTEGISGSTPSGVLVSPQAQAELERELANKQAQQVQERSAAKEAAEREKLRNEARMRTQLAEARGKVAGAGERVSSAGQQIKEVKQLEKAKSEADIAKDALKRAEKGKLGLAGNLGVSLGSSKILSPLLGAAGAAGMVMSADEAIRRWRAGDRSGAVLSTLEAIFGAMSLAPPVTPVTAAIKGIGTVGGLGLAGYELGKPAYEATRDFVETLPERFQRD
jgi:hypothetical protein